MAGRLRICHLSVLNPTTHTRIFEKQALPAAEAGHQVYIMATGEASKPHNQQGVLCWAHPLPDNRNWRQRLQIQLLLLVRCWRLRPQICHIHTPELLPLALILRWLLDCRIVYDRHEDYAANMLYARAYQGYPRHLLAPFFVILEHMASCWIDCVVYAEAAYEGSVPAPALTAPNRAMPNPFPHQRPPIPPLRLLVTGTLAPDWGTDAAMAYFEHMRLQLPCTLTLAGYAPSTVYAADLRQRCIAQGITLIGGDTYVPHTTLLELMRTHHLGLALYAPNPSIAGKVPTCFYEYMAAGLPFVFSENTLWAQLNNDTHMGIPLAEAIIANRLMTWLPQYKSPDRPHWLYNSRKFLGIYENLTT